MESTRSPTAPASGTPAPSLRPASSDGPRNIADVARSVLDGPAARPPAREPGDRELRDLAYEVFCAFVNQFDESPWSMFDIPEWMPRRQDGGLVPLDDVLAAYRESRAKYRSPATLDEIGAVVRRNVANWFAKRRADGLAELVKTVGPRHGTATLDGFTVTLPDQGKVRDALRTYAADIRARLADGSGIVLFGPAGSGKTHLMVAAAKRAIEADFRVRWLSGQELFAEFRATIDAKGSEDSFLTPFVQADVLALDDLLPPAGALTEFQAGWLWRVLDGRWRHLRPTWATLNAADGNEAGARLGAALHDRLRDSALCLKCDWPSYRKPWGKA